MNELQDNEVAFVIAEFEDKKSSIKLKPKIKINELKTTLKSV